MDWSELLSQALVAIAPLIVGVIVSLLAIGLKRLNAYLKAKVQNEAVQGAFDQISEIAMSTVNELEVSARAALGDGKISKEEAAELKRIAIDRIRAQAPKAIKVLTKAGMAELEAFLSGKIETYVAGLKPKGA